MKTKLLLFKPWIVCLIYVFLTTTLTFGQATLKHSYTFNDNTANDAVGTAHGTIVGGSITDGVYTTSSDGNIIELPGPTIAINTYSAITFEAKVVNSVGTPTNSMLYFFGGSVNNLGAYGTFLAPAHWRSGTLASICTVNETEPWNYETYVLKGTNPITTAGMHHVVVTIDATYLSMYVDGVLVGNSDLATLGNSIAGLSNDFAWIGRGGYTSDPTWIGSIDEFNIYEGAMEKNTIVQHASAFLNISIDDPTLKGLSADKGTLDPVFTSTNDSYVLMVPFGTTKIDVNPVPNVNGAAIKIYDGLGNLLSADGIVNFTGDGIDLEIIVTALDGITEKSYYLSIFLDPGAEAATLSSINLTVGSLTKEFNKDSTNYTVRVPYGTTSLNVTGTPVWPAATVTGGGTVNLTNGKGSTSITVVSENKEDTMTYNIDIYETKIGPGNYYYIVNEASDLLVLNGNLNVHPNLVNPLVGEEIQLWEFIESGVAGQYFIKNKLGNYLASEAMIPNDWNLTVQENLTGDLDSCRFEINEFEPGRFIIYTVARLKSTDEPHKNMLGPNDVNPNTTVYSDKWVGSSWDNNGYTIWNILFPDEVVDPYDTYLSDLSIDNEGLDINFNIFTLEYTITLPDGTNSLTISATPRDANASAIGTGTVNTSAGEGDIIITVSGADPSYTRNYTIHYVKDSPVTLMHSYTFADGTAKDVIGGADGTVAGGEITNGVFITDLDGEYITLPPEELALNTYPSITIETYVTIGNNDHGGDGQDDYTMLCYFGGLSGSNALWQQATRGGDEATNETANHSRTQVFADASSIDGYEGEMGENHHYVTVVSNQKIFWYIDGLLIGDTLLPSNKSLKDISVENAWIGESGWGDPSFIGELYEFNIYKGQMDAGTIASHALDFPVDSSKTDATLSEIKIDTSLLTGFASYKLEYNVVVPRGTTTVPAITAVAKYPNATAIVTPATQIPGITTILATAEDGTTTNTYKINFIIEVSVKATLSDLLVDGGTIDDFDPNVTSYDVVIPKGSTTIPIVTAVATDSLAKVDITAATTIPGTAEIVVTAEDGITKETYKVNFLYKFSTDAKLANLTSGGSPLADFDPNKVSYQVVLPEGTTSIPAVTATANNENATVVVTPAASVPGTTTIIVTAEDGTTKLIYTINYSVLTSIENIGSNHVKVYPTITNKDFTIETSNRMVTISVFDLNGNLILKKAEEGAIHNLHIPNAGMYFIKVEVNDLPHIFKVLKIN